MTFRQKNGKTIISERITSSNGSKMPAQQRHRMKWANIVKMYKGLLPLFVCAFEDKTDNVTDYNMFVKANINMQPVYLTKEEAAGDAWIHSRKSSGKTHVSSQMLIDNNSLLPKYTSEEAYQRAVETYGGEHEPLL